MSTSRKVWHLRRLDLFASMTDEEVEHLAELLDDRVISAGVELLKGIDQERVYLLKSGAVRLYQTRGDQQITVALLAPGRLFGLSSTFGNDDSTLGAVTLTEAHVCFTSWPKLIEVLSGHPGAVLQMMRGLAEQVFRAENWLARFGARSPRARLADLLVELADDFAEPIEGGCRVQFLATQADLARMVGVSRETISRLMRVFRELGLISLRGGHIIIHDRTRLLQEAHSSR
jgi:CRP-like cAMP-binding protein